MHKKERKILQFLYITAVNIHTNINANMYGYNEAFGVLIKQEKRRGFHTYLSERLA
jgi:hypothetical protein